MSQDHQQQVFESVLAMTIHDIKNSLALLIDKLDDDNTADNRNLRKYEIKRINNNLVRLLGLYKIGAERFYPRFDYHYVRDLLDEVAADYHDMMTARQIELEIDCDDTLEGRYDKPMLYSVIENAVNNASRYCQNRIKLGARVEDNRLAIYVEDDGHGFPQFLLDFNEQSTSEQPFDPSMGTTGLGFYFALVVAKLHESAGEHGRITLSNDAQAGGGRFEIKLPNETLADLGLDQIPGLENL